LPQRICCARRQQPEVAGILGDRLARAPVDEGIERLHAEPHRHRLVIAIGLGGETEGLRLIVTGVLAIVLVLCCRLAWRRRDAIGASGWASVALLFTLSWVLPWYVLWALPLAALSRSRRLRAAVLVAGAYLIVAWSPSSGLLWSDIGFHPENTPIGRLHERYIRELLQ